MAKRFQRRSSHICVCGSEKENVNQRYCNGCQKSHSAQMSDAHRDKGTGPRKFGWNRAYRTNYWPTHA